MATDINLKKLRTVPAMLKPYGVLMRLDRPIGWWLLLLPAWWGIILAGGPFEPRVWGLMALFWVGAIIMRGAGCVVNDLWDRRLDARVERTKTRPLASGEVSVRQALTLLGGLGILGLVILMQLPLTAILLGLATLPLIAVYPLMKRITWWPQLFLGLTFNFGALIGWAAVTNVVDAPAVTLYLTGLFWTLGYDTVYACMDRDDDRQVGIKSTALRFGAATKLWVYGFFLIAFAFFTTTLHLVSAPFWCFGLTLLTLCFALWRLWRWREEDMQMSLSLFKGQRDIGLMMTLILLLCYL